MTVTVSMPIGTHLSVVETHASRAYGGTWEVDPLPSGVWKDPINSRNFVWLVRRKI